MRRRTSQKENGVTLIALIVTIIVLSILAGETIYLAVNKNGIFYKAKIATGAYKNASEDEQTILNEVVKESEAYLPGVMYKDTNGKTQTLTTATPAGTKIGTTENISGKEGETGVNLDWYLFDVSDDGKTAYLVSTPTYWVPDTDKTREIRGALVPILVSAPNNNTYAIRQAIQQLPNEKNNYNALSVTYKPSDSTLNYFKSINQQWSEHRGTIDLTKDDFIKNLNENEQAACYLADADIFAEIKNQVNNAQGNLKGKIQTLVGGPSVEQWCKAYNKQEAAKNSQITCEYSTVGYNNTTIPGYIYKVNGKAQNSGWYTNEKILVGNDIYGAAGTKGKTSNNPFYDNSSSWWLASPSSADCYGVSYVNGSVSRLSTNRAYLYNYRFSLFASVSL